MYADDMQIYVSPPYSCISERIDVINSELKLVSNWARNNALQINPKKYK